MPSIAAAAATEWRLSVPAATPYDRQVLLQCIRSTVARWGAATIALGGERLLAAAGEPAAACSRCGRPTGAVQCQVAGHVTCLRCAVEGAGTEQSEQATVVASPSPRDAQRKPQRAHRRSATIARASSSAV